MNLTAADLAQMVRGPERDAAQEAFKRGDMAEVARILSQVVGAPATFQGYGPPAAVPAPTPTPAPTRQIKPRWAWALGGAAVMAATLTFGTLWAVTIPRGSPPPMLGPDAGKLYQSTPPTAPTPSTTPASSTTRAPGTCPPRPMGLRGAWCGDGTPVSSTANKTDAQTVPAQVLTPPAPSGATVCDYSAGHLSRCRWVPA